jgi:hypothetical protein
VCFFPFYMRAHTFKKKFAPVIRVVVVSVEDATQIYNIIKVLIMDNGGEFLESEFK